MISRQLDDALYRLKVVVLTRLADRVQSRLTVEDIEGKLSSGQSPQQIASLFKDYPRNLLTRAYKKWTFLRNKKSLGSSLPKTTELSIENRYKDNGDNTVTDIKTSLQWMQFSLGQEFINGTFFGQPKYTWQEAINAANVLNIKGGYASYCDWRVPTHKELQTLIYKNCHPTIDLSAFPNTLSDWYWSSSSYEHDSNEAWSISFNNGYLYAGSKTHKYHVRLVRGVFS